MELILITIPPPSSLIKGNYRGIISRVIVMMLKHCVSGALNRQQAQRQE